MAIKSKKIKYTARERMKFRIRKRILGNEDRPRVTVFKSGKHTYAQAVLDVSGKTVASASTTEKEALERAAKIPAEGLPNESKSSKSLRAAKATGILLAERLKKSSITKVVFDRNGYVYHGRIKALADGAREGGLEF